MIREELSKKIATAVRSLAAEGRLPEADVGQPEILDTKSPEHGDYACNLPLSASKKLGKPPREIAELLKQRLEEDREVFVAVEVAGPGFLNMRLCPAYVASFVTEVLGAGASYGSAKSSTGPKINVEFVSVNPNGPITVGSGRGAAFGSTLCNVLEAAGHTVHREYYINDGVNSEQMRQFAASVRAYVEDTPFPEKGYKGDYVKEVAERIVESLSGPRPGPKDWGTPREFGRLEVLAAAKRLRQAGYISEQVRLIISETGLPFVDFDKALPGLPALSKVSAELAWKHGLIPVLAEGSTLFVAMANPLNVAAQDEVRESSRCRIVPLFAKPEDVERALARYYPLKQQTGLDWYRQASQELMLQKQREDLQSFGVEFDRWFSEQTLHDSGKVEQCIADLQIHGVADTGSSRTLLKLARGGVIDDVVQEAQTLTADDEEEGPGEGDLPTLWLRSAKFMDDMDRVLRRRDGRLTYIASDVAYHEDKFNRPPNADKLITILGPDHHGYIGRLTAVVAAMLLSEGRIPTPEHGGPLSELEAKLYKSPEERDACHAALDEARKRLEVVIFQIVRFVKEGRPAPMRKRDGNIYALIDLIDEVGKTAAPSADTDEQRRIGRDVARFFYLMRSHDTHMDFDIDLATKQSDENPVFYTQYAHARICSVVRKAQEAGFASDERETPRLVHPREGTLIKKIMDLPIEVKRCAEDYGVHRLTTYATELARTYHHFYDVCRVIQPDQPELTRARLALCEATLVALRSTFSLLGISAPERMEREAVAE